MNLCKKGLWQQREVVEYAIPIPVAVELLRAMAFAPFFEIIGDNPKDISLDMLLAVTR
jgi:hypothetical protein